MPEVEYTATVSAPLERVWNYVEDLNQWCHLMIGFQALEIVDERRSIWTLRGDVGILTREVRIQVDITEWLPRDRVTFVVTGITERLEGGGAFLMTASDAPGVAGAVAAAAPAKKQGPWRRLRFRIARAMLRRLGRKAAAAQAAAREAMVRESSAAAPDSTSAGTPPAQPAPAASGAGTSQLTFQLRVTPQGPMAPMLDLLMAPMLEPAAHDLANGIRAAVEV
jgi:carbon monoxide dehydrogenase subunit G